MDVQDAKNLTITEGSVKTIHDENNQLLWGAVGYDTKYAGNTFQQTYSGKNLFNNNAEPITYIGSCETTALETGIRVTITGTAGTNRGAVYKILDAREYVGKTITLSFNATASSTNNTSAYIGLANADGSSRVSKVFLQTSGSVSYAIEQDEEHPYVVVVLYATRAVSSAVGVYCDFTNLQLEVSSTATSYEPYVGGTTSPNPDYPQNVNVVTGTQTVTISGGNNESQSYTVNLGSIELCKIGTYQDYIYKSGDDWYLHKETGKYSFDGSENWWKSSITSFNAYGLVMSTVDIAPIAGNGLWTHFTYYNSSPYAAGAFRYDSSGNLYVYFSLNSVIDTAAEFKTWLSGNTNHFYYALATPTDTQITDSTLISELNAIHDWLTRFGYTGTVTTSSSSILPLIIDKTNL